MPSPAWGSGEQRPSPPPQAGPPPPPPERRPEGPSPGAPPPGSAELPRAAAPRSGEGPGPQEPGRFDSELEHPSQEPTRPRPGSRRHLLATERAPVRPRAGLRPERGSGGQTRKPSHPAARGPCGAAAPALPSGAERLAPGASTSARPSPPSPSRVRPGGSAPASRVPHGREAEARRDRRSPPGPAAHCASGSGRVPCDVAARRGRLWAGGPGGRAGRGRPGAGRGAAAGWPGPPGAPPPPPLHDCGPRTSACPALASKSGLAQSCLWPPGSPGGVRQGPP
uniref:Uncharacterized protein LOC112829757 n=1 Tax=Callorhinus ursinus TaxID=34884 RepID=A0A3Q7PYX2_CALUR|nr:uncharacterized protein LOC112829757 [Callorhinus ursinus]